MVREFAFAQETHPALSSIPWGVQLCGQLAAGRNVSSMPRRHRETVRAVRTSRHRHHLPGIKNSKSEGYGNI